MLPSPNTASKRRDSRAFHAQHPTRSFDLSLANLRRPARITNLGFFLLSSTLALSLTIHLFHSFFPSRTYCPFERFSEPWSTLREKVPKSIAATLPGLGYEHGKSGEVLKHLVMVPGHGIWEGSREEDVLDERRWVLKEYQRGRGRVEVLVEHIRKGVRIALDDPAALLVFSGGQTSPFSITSEAESYHRLAHVSGLIPSSSTDERAVFTRATTEPFALDSYQNLLFSIARFKEYTGSYPTKITAVGYEFKRRRFEQLHRAALRYASPPSSNPHRLHSPSPPPQRGRVTVAKDDGRNVNVIANGQVDAARGDVMAGVEFEYVGLGLGAGREEEEIEAKKGELANSFLPYLSDPYGCHPPLSTKRLQRNPWARVHAYHLSAPELADLFEWCPTLSAHDPEVVMGELEAKSDVEEMWRYEGKVFGGRLPWV